MVSGGWEDLLAEKSHLIVLKKLQEAFYKFGSFKVTLSKVIFTLQADREDCLIRGQTEFTWRRWQGCLPVNWLSINSAYSKPLRSFFGIFPDICRNLERYHCDFSWNVVLQLAQSFRFVPNYFSKSTQEKVSWYPLPSTPHLWGTFAGRISSLTTLLKIFLSQMIDWFLCEAFLFLRNTQGEVDIPYRSEGHDWNFFYNFWILVWPKLQPMSLRFVTATTVYH